MAAIWNIIFSFLLHLSTLRAKAELSQERMSKTFPGEKDTWNVGTWPRPKGEFACCSSGQEGVFSFHTQLCLPMMDTSSYRPTDTDIRQHAQPIMLEDILNHHNYMVAGEYHRRK